MPFGKWPLFDLGFRMQSLRHFAVLTRKSRKLALFGDQIQKQGSFPHYLGSVNPIAEFSIFGRTP